MADPDWERIEDERDTRQIVLEAVEELIADFGASAFVRAAIDSTAGESFERMGSGVAPVAINRILAQIIDSRDARMEADIISLASGLNIRLGTTMTDIGRKYGKTKQWISLRVRKCQEDLGLSRNHINKSEEACNSYRIANKPRV